MEKCKRITFTMDAYEYRTLFNGLKGNKSAFLRQLIRRGLEYETAEADNFKTRILQLKQELYNKNEEIQRLKAKTGRLESKLSGQTLLNTSAEIDKLDIVEVETILNESGHKREIVADILKVLDRDASYVNGCRLRYNNETGQNLSAAGFNTLVAAARELRDAGRL